MIAFWFIATGVHAQKNTSVSPDTLPVEYRLHYTNSIFNSIEQNPAYAGAAQQSVFKTGFEYNMPFLAVQEGMHYPFAASVSYDGYIGKKKNFGIGSSILYTSEPFKFTEQALLAFNYRFKLGKFSKLRVGLSLIGFTGGTDFNAIHFPDEYNYHQGHVYQTSEEYPGSSGYSNVNFGAGLFYTRKLLWAGFSVANLTEPEVRYFSLSRIPRVYYASVGNTFRLRKEVSVIPSVNFTYKNKDILVMPSVMASWKNMLGAGISMQNVDFFYARLAFNFFEHIALEGFMEIPLKSTVRNGFGWLTSVGGSLKYSFAGNKNLTIIR